MASRPLRIVSCSWALALAAAWLAAATGCNRFTGSSPEQLKDPKSTAATGPMKVKAEGPGLTLEAQTDTDRACAEFCSTIERLLNEQRITTARRYVQRYPDLSLEVLQTQGAEKAASPTFRFIAQARDQQCTLDPAHGWEATVNDRVANPDRYAKYDKARAEYLELLKLGKPEKAAALPLMSLAASTPSAVVSIDAGKLTGIAWQLAGRHEDAIATLTQTADLAARNDLHQAAHVRLLLSDAQRVGGQFPLAEQSWQSATLIGGDWLVRPVPILDPVFWEHASYLRPAKTFWPEPVQQRLAEATRLTPTAGDPNTLLFEAGKITPSEWAVFACMGQWRLTRNEPQAALLAFKRAESCALNAGIQDRLRMRQAKALSRLEQQGAATAILMALAKSPDPSLARAAASTFGGMKLQAGHTEFGFRVLQRAIEQDELTEWPERAEAEADLGLAYLMMNDESAGLRWLHSAQQRFEANRDHELLAKSLWNESRYFEQKGKHAVDVEGINSRLQAIENAVAMPGGAPFTATPIAQLPAPDQPFKMLRPARR